MKKTFLFSVIAALMLFFAASASFETQADNDRPGIVAGIVVDAVFVDTQPIGTPSVKDAVDVGFHAGKWVAATSSQQAYNAVSTTNRPVSILQSHSDPGDDENRYIDSYQEPDGRPPIHRLRC